MNELTLAAALLLQAAAVAWRHDRVLREERQLWERDRAMFEALADRLQAREARSARGVME